MRMGRGKKDLEFQILRAEKKILLFIYEDVSATENCCLFVYFNREDFP